MRPLIDPVWILIVLLSLGIFSFVKYPELNKYFKTVGKIALGILIFLSTGVATFAFDNVLATESSPPAGWRPEFIFVLGGGYEVGATEAQDFLGTESIRRVNAASDLWTKYPQAKVIFSGQQPGTQDDRPAARHGELSAAQAKLLGLKGSRIIIESASQNTQQHPIEALKVAGVTKDSEIVIVTSDFHLRRALGAFKNYFNNVSAFGTGDATQGLSWLDFVPLASHLNDNTYRIKEFAGIIIY